MSEQDRVSWNVRIASGAAAVDKKMRNTVHLLIPQSFGMPHALIKGQPETTLYLCKTLLFPLDAYEGLFRKKLIDCSRK